MTNLFARNVALTNVAGRLDYISNPLKQEHLLSTYDTASDLLDGQYWQILARESQAAFEQYGAKSRTVTRAGKIVEQQLQCEEAREVYFLLGNEILDRMTPDEALKKACDAVSQRIGRPVTGAMHLNKSTRSLHVHIIYSDRELLQDPIIKVAERNLFFDAQGKRCYKKSEILDENKQLLPGCKIIAKGEIYESRCFGSVDKRMLDKDWLKDLKTNCILELRNGELKGDIEITEYDPSTGMLPQQYIGNRVPDDKAAEISEYNVLVREYNAAVLDGIISHEEAMDLQCAVLGSNDRNGELAWIMEQIREIIEEEREENGKEKKKSLSLVVSGAESRKAAGSYDGNIEGAWWQKYRSIRDKTWETFILGQRSEFKAIREWKEERQLLYFQNSHAVFDKDGNEVGRRLNKKALLEQSNYYEQRDEIKLQLKRHDTQLKAMRKYQEVAKGRQKIVRALLLAGADKDVIDAAMKNYEAAMQQLQNYVENPDSDYENRRLKVAQWSLAQAQARADNYIKKLEEERLQEESRLEIIAEKEYQEFRKDGTIGGGSVGGQSGPSLQVEIER